MLFPDRSHSLSSCNSRADVIATVYESEKHQA